MMAANFDNQKPEITKVLKTLKAKYTVQHRSDLLMHEQVDTICHLQEALKSAVSNIEHAKTESDCDRWTMAAFKLKEKTDKIVIELQVMRKLDTELSYARADLNDALYKGIGNINAARKRVIWLENKMSKLHYEKQVKEQEMFGPSNCDKLLSESPKGQNVVEQSAGKDQGQLEESGGKQKTAVSDEYKTDGESDRKIGDNVDNVNIQQTYTSLSLDEPSCNEADVSKTLEIASTQQENKDSDQEKISKENEVQKDLGAAYWQSEHHRFEYSDLSATGYCDPLSYNSMGLAVRGSFLSRSDTDFAELPWQATQSSKDIKDIHREALDKLATKVHNMQDRIFHATTLSFHHQTFPDTKTPETSFFRNYDTDSLTPAGHKGLTMKSNTILATYGCKKQGQMSSKLEYQSAVSHVFYPKPLPPPNLLPITRTNHQKEFPQLASSFFETDPQKRAPSERIVDQRNLIEETRLVLYHQKTKPRSYGPSSIEKQFQKASQNYIKPARKKVCSQLNMAADLTSMQLVRGAGRQIKPRSGGIEYRGLRWERVKSIVHHKLTSGRVEERIDAAKQLGLLRCGDAMVFYALKECIHKDPDYHVRYEATKALIFIGCWEDDVLRLVLQYLVLGNTEIRMDLIGTLIDGKNVMFVDKSMPTFLEMVKILSHFCQSPDPEDTIAFHSAVLLGRLCVHDANAEARLLKALEESTDCHIKVKALEILVKQLGRRDKVIVEEILNILDTSPVWKYRVLASQLIISLGPQQKSVLEKQERLYDLLTRHLWDDSSGEVRLTAAKTLAALGMFARASEDVENHLEDTDEKKRAEAVISLATLGMRNERVVRLLLEMLELDASEYVRLMIIRTFTTLRLTDRRVLRSLREREKTDGSLAREAKKALAILESVPHHMDLLLGLDSQKLSDKQQTRVSC